MFMSMYGRKVFGHNSDIFANFDLYGASGDLIFNN